MEVSRVSRRPAEDERRDGHTKSRSRRSQSQICLPTLPPTAAIRASSEIATRRIPDLCPRSTSNCCCDGRSHAKAGSVGSECLSVAHCPDTQISPVGSGVNVATDGEWSSRNSKRSGADTELITWLQPMAVRKCIESSHAIGTARECRNEPTETIRNS
jgi:hypothetical protein